MATFAKKGQAENLIFGGVILGVGTVLVVIWAIGEALGNPALSTLGKWGLGLFPILIEIVQAIIRGLK